MNFNLLKISVLFLPFFAFGGQEIFRHSNAVADSLLNLLSMHSANAQYTLAEKEIKQLEQIDAEVAQLMRAMKGLARYDDLGSPKDLKKAYEILVPLADKEKPESTEQKFWFSLANLQLGFAKILLGESVSGAMTVRSAANDMQELPYLEAKGFYGMYAYNFSQATSWVPFVSDETEESLNALKSSVKKSRYFSGLFLNALGWILFDRKEFGEALGFLKVFLGKNPGNRVLQQMQADQYKAKGEFEKSKKIYVKNLQRYQKLKADGCVRALSALGNLALLENRLGEAEKASSRMKIFRSKLPKVEEYMPPSLREEMEENGLNWSTP